MAKENKEIQKKEAKVTIVPFEKEKTDRIYSNYVVIRHSAYDFSLEFCEITPPTEQDHKEVEKTKQVKANIKTKIILPTKIIPLLIKALTDNYNNYVKLYEKK